MANNPILFNAALLGAFGGINTSRSLQSSVGADYATQKANALAFATLLDGQIPVGSYSQAEADLLGAMVQQIVSGKGEAAVNLTLIDAIIAAFDLVRSSLEPVVIGGSTDFDGDVRFFGDEFLVSTAGTDRLKIGLLGTWEVNGDAGDAGQVLTSQGGSNPPAWQGMPDATVITGINNSGTFGPATVVAAGHTPGVYLIGFTVDIQTPTSLAAETLEYSISGSFDGAPSSMLLTQDSLDDPAFRQGYSNTPTVAYFVSDGVSAIEITVNSNTGVCLIDVYASAQRVASLP